MPRRDAPFADPRVRAVFRSYPPDVRVRLLELRRLIFDTASRTAGVGKLVEALKWGQPSYLTAASGSGSTIRIDTTKDEPRRYALFVHCQTDLVANFRELYPRTFEYRDSRALVLDAGRKLPESALRHCIALALTYHARKRKRGSVSPAATGYRRRAHRARPSL